MKIAIPVENGCLHEHFGGCGEFALCEIDSEGKRALAMEVVAAQEHRPGLFPLWLKRQGVGVVITGGIGRRALEIFALNDIGVCQGMPGATVAQLVEAYLGGRLTTTPEGCEHHDHEHGHAHGHHHHGG